jgi:hypothetical protein
LNAIKGGFDPANDETAPTPQGRLTAKENVAEMLALRIDSNIRPPGFHRIELNWRAD